MSREYKSKVGWWYHLVVLVLVGASIAMFVNGSSPFGMVGVLLLTLLCIHMLLSTWYRITDDDVLVVHCSIFPEKRIPIAEIEALEPCQMPVSSYALSLDRLIVWTQGKPWILISPTNKADFVKQLRTINPNIQLKQI